MNEATSLQDQESDARSSAQVPVKVVEQSDQAIALGVPLELRMLLQTQPAPQLVFAFIKAIQRAVLESHPVVGVDHLLAAIASQEVGALALDAAGVRDVEGLRADVLVQLDRTQPRTLPKGAQPAIDKALDSLWHLAMSFAGRAGRDTADVADLVDAVLDVLEKGGTDTPGLRMVRLRWSKPSERAQLIDAIREVHARQMGELAMHFAGQFERMRSSVSALEQSVDNIDRKVVALQEAAVAAPVKKRSPMRLLHGFAAL